MSPALPYADVDLQPSEPLAFDFGPRADCDRCGRVTFARDPVSGEPICSACIRRDHPEVTEGAA